MFYDESTSKTVGGTHENPIDISFRRNLIRVLPGKGEVVVEEVVMPDDLGIVDTLSLRLLPDDSYEWRCFELKVSKGDFRSPAKLSFVGHYNYFVLPEALYQKVAEEIPEHVGVLVYHGYANPDEHSTPGYLVSGKKARYQELQVNEKALLYHLITAQAREVGKAKQTERGLRVFGTDQLYKELKRRQPEYDLYGGGVNYYDRFLADTQEQATEALKEELAAYQEAYQALLLRLEEGE